MGESRTGRSSRKGLLWTLIPLVVIVIVAVIVVVVATHVDDDSTATPAGIPPRPALIQPVATIAPVNASDPEPTPEGVAATLAPLVGVPAVGNLTGEVIDAISGTSLWSRNPTTPMTPASATKILTAAAALLSLPLDGRITTNAVMGSGGQVILVGAGDPTLTEQPVGQPTLFTTPPRISDLAAQIRRSGVAVTSVGVDTSAFSGPSMASTWETSDIAAGNIAPIQSLMADSGRKDPLGLYSPRTATPAVDAGSALARALGLSGDAVREVSAPAGAKVLASVTSAPLSTRLADMVTQSDDVLAETIGIEVSKATGGQASLVGAVSAVRKVLADNGFDLTGVTLDDVNGLSVGNRIPASLLASIIESAAGGNAVAGTKPAAQAKLRPLLDTFPVGGANGTLSDRFVGEQSGAGWVRAKTGTLTGVSTLSGIVQTTDNRVLVFALMSSGTNPADARPALDDIASALHGCGCR